MDKARENVLDTLLHIIILSYKHIYGALLRSIDHNLRFHLPEDPPYREVRGGLSMPGRGLQAFLWERRGHEEREIVEENEATEAKKRTIYPTSSTDSRGEGSLEN
jgi:hypothetical protein